MKDIGGRHFESSCLLYLGALVKLQVFTAVPNSGMCHPYLLKFHEAGSAR